jgi:superfamily II DNA/RNA helicase
MPPEITRLTKQFLNNPTRIEASKPATTAENIAQHLVRIPSADPAAKRVALRELVGAANVKNGIVFCNRKTEVDVVAKSLRSHGFDASAIHGDLDQSTRMRTLEAFRKGDLKLLVASDVAARGLDIPDVSHVFNYDVPHHADDYVHRIGRTGRAGKSGDTFMIVTPADSRTLDKVLKLIGQAPDEVVLDVDWSQVKESPKREKGGRERAGSRSGRPVRDHAPRTDRRPSPEHAAMSPATPQPDAERWAEPAAQASATAEAPPERAPRQAREGERPRSRPRKPRAEVAAAQSQTAPTAEPKPERPRQERQPRRDDREDRDDNNGVRGFGADTPAFLLRGK